MDFWFWFELALALLAWGTAWLVYKLDYDKKHQAGYGDDRLHRRTRRLLGALILTGAAATVFLALQRRHEEEARVAKDEARVANDEATTKKLTGELTGIRATLNEVADAVGAPVENVVKAIEDLKARVDAQEENDRQQARTLGEVDRRTARRRFSEKQSAAIKKVLSATPQKGPVALFLPMTDEETVAYALQLEAIFADAGWKVIRRDGSYRSGSGPTSFHLQVGTDRVPPDHPYFAVKAALEAAGLKCTYQVKDRNAESGGVVIHLPPKPPLPSSTARPAVPDAR